MPINTILLSATENIHSNIWSYLTVIKNPSLDDILAVAKNVGIKEKQARDIALDIKNKCLSLVD